MLDSQSTLAALLAAPVRPGRLMWIGLRPARGAPMQAVQRVRALTAQGLEGDRYRTSSNGKRQVTLIQAEDLAAIASYLGRDEVLAGEVRRNLLTRGINLLALKGKRFRVGEALLEYSGECHPCSKMETLFGTGGYNAMRGHGGITARILEDGLICLGDAVEVLPG
ncbi:MOSC domain-containing protein [Stutzerimonas tarimensis]|uniref:MOSC domain-containing protein n=1 Tax=Stutzerimonas tarimensis TaxID=1507735 RepID=A0ABV7T758_9GAMM